VCTLVERKGVQYILQAVRELVSRLSRSISLDIVGDGPERESLEQKAEDLGIGDLVVFRGYVDDPEELSKLYLNSDIFVFHSFHEGQPRVLDEAAIHGLPIVATDLPGIQMNFHHQKSALLYKPAAYLDLVECICRLARSETLATRLATNARQDFYRRFEFRSAAEQHASLLIQQDLR
jgi:glycosyltransferase involved in cell wall biosynthesis